MQQIYVPSLGMASEGVYLAEWCKSPGDPVVAGEAVALIETDKAELTLEAAADGILGRHRFEAGTEVPNGATIAVLLENGESEPGDDAPGGTGAAAAAPAAADAPAPAAPASSLPTAKPSAAVLEHADRIRDDQTGELLPYELSPRSRAAELDRLAAAPAGPAPAVMAPAVMAPAEPAPAAPQHTELAPAAPQHAEPTPQAAAKEASRADDSANARYRNAIAEAVTRSWSEIPHFAVTRDIRTERMSEVQLAFRVLDPTVTFTDVLLKAYALSLMQHFDTDDIALGLAVATERGVAIPVVLDVARSGILEIARRRRAAVERALLGKLDRSDAQTPRSTVSNLGAFGVDSFTGIVPDGQTSILTVGAASRRPVVEGDSLVVGSSMTVTLNADHRVWDGQHVGEVLRRFAGIAAQPTLLNHIAHNANEKATQL